MLKFYYVNLNVSNDPNINHQLIICRDSPKEINGVENLGALYGKKIENRFGEPVLFELDENQVDVLLNTILKIKMKGE